MAIRNFQSRMILMATENQLSAGFFFGIHPTSL
jgi:hypothetical protein